MAAIALVTANKVEVVETIDQMTAPARWRHAGQAVQITTTGKWILAKADTAALARRTYIATRTVAGRRSADRHPAGRDGRFDLSGLAYNAPVYLSDTGGSRTPPAPSATSSATSGRLGAAARHPPTRFSTSTRRTPDARGPRISHHTPLQE
jgi:hypothetical protein